MKITVRHIILSVLLAFFAGVVLNSCGEKRFATLDESALSELSNLDKALANSEKFDNEKIQALDSLRSVLNRLPVTDVQRRWDVSMQLGEDFKLYCADSALYYFNSARRIATELGNDSLHTLSEISFINALSVAGLFFKAREEMQSLDSVSLSADQQLEYWKVKRQHFSYLLGYVEGYDSIESEVRRQFAHYNTIILNNIDKNTPTYRFLKAEEMVAHGEYRQAEKRLTELLSELSRDDNLYGMAAFQLAEAYRFQGDDSNYVKYLALASISDIEGSVKETLALQTLAKWLYNNNDFDRAYNYINTSSKNAAAANAKMRTVSISEILPLIDNAQKARISSSRDQLKTYLIFSILLLVVSTALLVMMILQIRKTKFAQRRLAKLSVTQDSYIGHFLGLCSSYAEKLNALSKLVVRKISSGQSDELVKLVKSGKFGEDQAAEFFKVFDTAFIDMNPDFIDNINSLLRPEERFDVKPGQALPADLRIYAFVRLGVDESVKIARILHYSTATVYAYRNRMRNKAINRDTFDKDVMNIGHPDL